MGIPTAHDLAELTALLGEWVWITALGFLVVVFDERRLDEERLARAWPRATRDVALVWLGVFAVPLHFARTRGDFRSARGVARFVLGLGLGLVCAVGIVVLGSLGAWLLETVLGV